MQGGVFCIPQIPAESPCQKNKETTTKTADILLEIKTDYLVILFSPLPKDLCVSGKGCKNLKFKLMKSYFVQI